MTYTITHIAAIVKGTLALRKESEIRYLSTDSRTVSFPESTLFFAIKTPYNDGHKYITNLYEKGVRNFMITTYTDNLQSLTDANIIVVPDSVTALQQLTAYHRHNFSVPVIGITGSNGKTIVKEWLYQLLSPDKKICRSPKSYNSQIGVPLSVWELDETTDIGIFEAGISQPGEMKRIASVIQPTIGILTNIGAAHQENFESLSEKCEEKTTLFSTADSIIYNEDDPVIQTCISTLKEKEKFRWSRKNKNATLYIPASEIKGNVTEIHYTFRNQAAAITIPFTDQAAVENAITCLCCICLLNMNNEEIPARFASLEPIDMRLEVKKGINGCHIINDSYNSDFNSLNIALDFLSKQTPGKNNKHTVILSDILESGENPESLYQQVSRLLTQKGVERLIGIGKDLCKNARHFNMDATFYEDTTSFLQQFTSVDFANETILLKGARKFHFEEIAALLESKFHETVMEVNLNALVHNYNYAKSKLAPETKIVGMVKASGYGSGAVEIAKTLQHQRCDYFAVAFADEGAELRKAGIYTPIMILNPEKSAFPSIVEYRMEPEIYSFEMLEKFSIAVKEAGLNNYPIHIKIDTGMHRVGFDPEETDALIASLKENKQLLIKSVFSHLAGSDDPVFDPFTKKQIERFRETINNIKQAFSHRILFHILNSSGIERFPEAQFDMVRFGIGLYGISSTNDPELQHVCTLKTIIQQIKHIPKTETVGYSRKGVLEKDSRIGAIPIGYADGFDRRLSNRNGYVLVQGKKAPVIGNICMDIAMIDLTDIPEAQVGDTVTIFGNELPLNVLAEQMGTIPYEVLTGISERIKRIYFQE